MTPSHFIKASTASKKLKKEKQRKKFYRFAFTPVRKYDLDGIIKGAHICDVFMRHIKIYRAGYTAPCFGQKRIEKK